MTALPSIRTLTLSEVQTLIDWARSEGWNPGRDDAAPMQAADPDGFIGCFLNGAMVAGISAVRYGEDFGFIGLYLCHPDHRGNGYGRLVWNAAMAHLSGRVIGLDGVPEQQGNYARMGFAPVYRTLRWSGRASARLSRATEIRDAATSDLADLEAFDRLHFPAHRPSFLDLWLQPPRVSVVAEREGRIEGYAVLRDCADGAKIGPLFATSEPIAEELLAACLCQHASATIHLDVPNHQIGFADVLKRLGFQPGFTTARMYRGKPPSSSLAGVFAVTTLELG
jgi:ribosomal protein S18 acetylase RimI-like enzyme